MRSHFIEACDSHDSTWRVYNFTYEACFLVFASGGSLPFKRFTSLLADDGGAYSVFEGLGRLCVCHVQPYSRVGLSEYRGIWFSSACFAVKRRFILYGVRFHSVSFGTTFTVSAYPFVLCNGLIALTWRIISWAHCTCQPLFTNFFVIFWLKSPEARINTGLIA